MTSENEYVSLDFVIELGQKWDWPMIQIPMLFDKSEQISIIDFLTEKGFEYEHLGYEDNGSYIESIITVDVPKLQS